MRDRIKRLELISISNIVGFSGGNPKKRTDRDRAILGASLDQHGYVLPVAVRELPDGRFELIDGHGRIDDIRANERATEIKVLVLDVSSVAEGREVLLALKHTADWNFDELDDFVGAAIKGGSAVERIIASSGLGAAELASLGAAGLEKLQSMANGTSKAPTARELGATPPARKQLEEDVAPAPPKKPTSKRGDVWTLGDSLLFCVDCTSIDPAQLAIGKLGFAITSPPYNAGVNVEKAMHKKGKSDSRYNESDALDADAYAELLDVSTRVALGACRTVAINLQSLAPNKRIIARWAARFANHLVDRAVWKKTSVQPAFRPNVLNSQFEDIYIFGPDDKPTRTIETGKFHGTVSNVHEGPGAGRDNDYSDVHGATMPVHLAQWLIEDFGTAADFVVDVFGGTGTSLVVAEQLGKRAAVVERDLAYCDVIVERWQKVTGKKARRR